MSSVVRTSVALPMFSWPHTTLPLLRVAMSAAPAMKKPGQEHADRGRDEQLDVGSYGRERRAHAGPWLW